VDQSGKSFAYDISGKLSIDVVISLIYKKEKTTTKESLNILTVTLNFTTFVA